MSGLFLSRADPSANIRLDCAHATFSAHGLHDPSSLSVSGWTGLLWRPAFGGPTTLLRSDSDFVAVAGTLVFDGRIGQAALERLLEAASFPNIDWSRIGGEFTAMVHIGGRSFLLCDYFASYQLFHDVEANFFSTSFLAATGAMPRVNFDVQGIYEYAFNAAPVGDDTVIDKLKTLGPDRMIELLPDGVRMHSLRKTLPTRPSEEPLSKRIADHREQLLATIAPFVAHFGNRIHCPLSGGLDSRLVLAALRAAGSLPKVYVYGPPGDKDVEIARQIGRNQGFKVDWIDKAAVAPSDPELFSEQVRRNFHAWDALPNFGNIFDSGGNSLARDARHANGDLAVSGGCGEVFRDFFYLPNRRLSANEVARAFFGRFDPKDVTTAFDRRIFLERIGMKIGTAIGEDPERPMSRTKVEQIYPRIRCRALFGREISLENRAGYYAMPFLDHQMVAAALTLPMHLKRAGRFESQLLKAIDPWLAAEPSAYGHDFTGAPNLKHRCQEWSTRSRPIWLREKSYAIQRRMRPMSDEHGGLLSPDYMGRVIDLEFPAMRRFFRVERIRDSGLWRRIAALEYFAGQLGSRLSS